MNNIVVVGGGTAGWLSAGYLAARHDVSVTLVESPDVASLGVGEGTWPSMRHTLQVIGIDEHTFIQECNVSLKQGSLFKKWVHGRDDDAYYHPFITPPAYGEYHLADAWHTLSGCKQAFADFASVQASICDAGLAPKQIQTPAYAGVANYGYHLDAAKFAELLKRHCIGTLGVRHISDHVLGVTTHNNGDIASLLTAQSGDIDGSLFIDCTGMNSLLLHQHYKVAFKQQDHVLFNNRALAVHVPYSSDNQNIASATISTAQSSGWIWNIGLQNRMGVGYTYSDKFNSELQAQDTLMQYIEELAGRQQASQIESRAIRFEPGYREKFWVNNCVAVGMSAGFFEPLEASAIAMIELSLTMISENLPKNREHMDIISTRFNKRFTYRWERIVDFLKLHYVLSRRNEDYWLANREASSIPDSLQELLELWKYQSPNRHDLIQNEEVFPSASYQYVLYGMGYGQFTHQANASTTSTHASSVSATEYNSHAKLVMAEKVAQQVTAQKQQYLAALPSNRDYISYILSLQRSVA
ncbi:tryptophan 7-halogenase [Glaciecola sp. MH2013]|uniref:tryptophan halogenase family protein n=1 Tax=Glaciecola sp. MH2013 TaxID=2785524 RepID=UPI00189D56F1|nr:tryptophan halogenase family protein [Glaciecola sp. MH2013]MBF7073197.1 tryptophan 7-halogenase [Glaciecola sp. MH2013]